MDNFLRKIQANRKHALILCFAFAVFIGTFGFPAVNFGRSSGIGITNIFILLIAYFEIGLLMAALFPKKNVGLIILINFIHVLAGMCFRYLLEFGEVSNIYNFTPPNVIFHTLIVIVYSTAVWFYISGKLKI